jgi:dihydrofolate reductase
VTISLVVAVADNGVIGRKGKLPWHLPDDLRRFKELTTGHTVVMGRRTFESIGRALPNRRNVVLTRNRTWAADGAEVVHDLASFLGTADQNEEILVIGGAEVFNQTLPMADRVYLTSVHVEVEGETVFAGLDQSEWELLSEEQRGSDESHASPFSFRVYERRPKKRPAP